MRGSGVTAARSCLQPLVSASRYLAVHALPGDPLYFVVEVRCIFILLLNLSYLWIFWRNFRKKFNLSEPKSFPNQFRSHSKLSRNNPKNVSISFDLSRLKINLVNPNESEPISQSGVGLETCFGLKSRIEPKWIELSFNWFVSNEIKTFVGLFPDILEWFVSRFQNDFK